MRSRVVYAVSAMLCAAVVVVEAQNPVQQGTAPAAGTLALSNVNAAAREATLAALADYSNWHFDAAYRDANKALEIDSTFGLARILRELNRGDGAPIAAAEYQRGFRDMSTRPIPEITFGLGEIAQGVNAARLLAAAKAMYPNDRYVAVEAANVLTGQARLDSLRAVAAKYPDFVGPRVWYAYQAVLSFYASYSPAAIDDAMKMAMEAMRIAPTQSAPHLALGHVLLHAGRRDEALPHVMQAIKLDPASEYGHYLAAEIYMYDGKPGAVERARAALDTAVSVSPNLGRQSTQRRDRAILLVHDGRLQQAEAELLAIAADAEQRSAANTAAGTYQDLAVLFAGARDTAKMNHYVAESHRAQATVNRELEVDAYGLARMPLQARAALDFYMKANPTLDGSSPLARRLAATVAYAEGKYDQVLSDCTDTNPYCDLMKVEALFAAGRAREAEAMRAAFFAKKDASAESRAGAIMRYRAAHP